MADEPFTARNSPPKDVENGAEFGKASSELDIDDRRLRGGGGMGACPLPVAISGNAGEGVQKFPPDGLVNAGLWRADGEQLTLLLIVLSPGLRVPMTS